MKKNTGNAFILCAATLLAGVTSTNPLDASNYRNSTNEQTTHNVSYTAHGKTDRKTALLFQQLMQNNRNLQVHAEVIKKPARYNKPQRDVNINYTITGKTDMKTVRKLVKLFNSSKAIDISMVANTGTQIANQKPRVKDFRPQQIQNPYTGSAGAYSYNYQPPYYYGYNTGYYGYNNGYYGYNNYPPIYVQGNIIWYPVPVAGNYVGNTQPPASVTVASN